MNKKRRMVIVAATSAIAEHCCRLWVTDQALHLILVGRNQTRLQAVADDLSIRSPGSTITTHCLDFLDPTAITNYVAQLADQGQIDLALIAHGWLPEQAQCQRDLSVCNQALAINGTSPVLFAEAFAQHMEVQKHGKIVIIGSIAGDRGKASNYVYGAAKGLIERYVQGLQHRFARSNIKVILIKPGPTDTPMTAQFKEQGRAMASVQSVAKSTVRAIGKNKAIVYVPLRWFFIMRCIQHLPQFIFNRLKI